MSILDGDGKEVVQVSAIWSLAFKLLLALTPVIGTVGLAWSIWVTTSIYGHSETIAVLKTQITSKTSRESASLELQDQKNQDANRKIIAGNPTRK